MIDADIFNKAGGKGNSYCSVHRLQLDNTMAEEKALGLHGTKRIENIQMGLARAVDIRNSTGKSKYLFIYVRQKKNKQETKTVMKGDFDSLARLEIF